MRCFRYAAFSNNSSSSSSGFRRRGRSFIVLFRGGGNDLRGVGARREIFTLADRFEARTEFRRKPEGELRFGMEYVAPLGKVGIKESGAPARPSVRSPAERISGMKDPRVRDVTG